MSREEAATEAYREKFGEFPNVQWYEGDFDAYAELLERAVATGEPLPDYEAAHGIPPDCLT